MISFLLPLVIAEETKPVPDPESELIQQLILGDKRGLEKLYKSYSAALLGIISRIVKQPDLAEDVLQETFVKIWKSADQYDAAKGRLFTWMARLARNKAIDHLRSRGELNSLKNDDLNDFTLAVNELHQIHYNPEIIGIRQLMNVLTPEQKAILDLVYFQGYTQLEASQALNIPIGTVKTRIRFSIKVLRSFF